MPKIKHIQTCHRSSVQKYGVIRKCFIHFYSPADSEIQFIINAQMCTKFFHTFILYLRKTNQSDNDIEKRITGTNI